MILYEEQIKNTFEEYYPHFTGFINDPIWKKCIEAALDKELLSHIIFCNDLFGIPPVKTFLTYYEDYFTKYCDCENGLATHLKKSIGAFWGNIFKFVLVDELGNRIYNDQKNVYVGISSLKVSTATYFIRKTNG